MRNFPTSSVKGRQTYTKSSFSGLHKQTTLSGLPAGVGPVGTAGNPSPQFPGVRSGLKPAYKPTPNSGGIIQNNATGQRMDINPDANYKGAPATGFGANTVAQSNPAITEAPNAPDATGGTPLSSDGLPPQPAGKSEPTKPIVAPPTNPAPKIGPGLSPGNKAQSLPPSTDTDAPQKAAQKAQAPSDFIPGDPNAPGGQLAPQPGDDPNNELAGKSVSSDLHDTAQGVQDDLNGGDQQQHVGGHDAYARTFSNPKSADLYHQYYQKLTGDTRGRQGVDTTAASGTPSGNAKLAKGVAGAPPRDNGTESDGGEDYA
jgi:hypothetical protein